MKNYATRPRDPKQPPAVVREPAPAAMSAAARPGPQALPPPWWLKPRRTARWQERKLQDGRMDRRSDRRTQMAAVSRAVVCQERDNRMTEKTNNSLTPVSGPAGRPPVKQPGPPPVRVKLRRVNANLDEGLSAGRRGQGVVETAEEGPWH